MKPFKTIDTEHPQDLNRIQSNMALFAAGVASVPLLDGVLLEDVTLTSSETKVNHKLGRKYRGWIVVGRNTNQPVWASSSSIPERFLSLTAGGSVTVSLWVF